MVTRAHVSPTLDPPEGRILLHDVDWGGYEKMLQIIGDRHIHVTYDDGTMEVRMPSQQHERAAQLLGFVVGRIADELELDYEALGMTTWRRPDMDKGLEADQCYYIRNAALARGREELDLEVDPPPDLAIEVDITSSSLNRMGVYAGLRVPEVWRYDGHEALMHQLGANGEYHLCETSLSFPGLRAADIVRLIDLGRTVDKRQLVRAIEDFVRNELVRRTP
jgi:Uma2 family endonuclease